MNIYYQEGGQAEGQEEQLMQLFQAFADIVQDDEFNTAEEVMQMFMELTPEEQQAFVQQAIQIVQQEQGEQEVENEPQEELMEQQEVQPMMQQGGINPQKIQQILQAYASSIGEDPNVIFQQFQQMKPEEQQQALQQIVQQLQGGQMQMQKPQQMKDGGYVNNTGYLEGYESSNNPYNIIPSNRITMKGVRPDIQYIKGTDNLGNVQYMDQGGEYKFDGDFVVEEPVYAQSGTGVNDLTKQLQQVEISLNKQKKERDLQLQKLSKEKQTSENQIKIARVKEFYNKELGKINSLKDNIRLGLPFILKNPNDPNLQLKLKDYKDAIKELDVKTKNLNRLTPDNFDYINSRAVPKKESGIVFSDVFFGYPRNIEYSDLSQENKSDSPIIRGGSTGKPIEMKELSTEKGRYIGSDGNEWLSTDGGKNFKIVKKQTTPTNQDKPKIKLPDKKTKTALAEKEKPFILQPPPVPTEIPEMVNNNYQFEIPLMDLGNYYIPEEERVINIKRPTYNNVESENPNLYAFDRTNIGVGKRFFKQHGGDNYMQQAGYVAPKFKSIGFNPRLDANYDMNIGAETNMKRYGTNDYRTKLLPSIGNSTEQQFDMGKTSPIGNFTQQMFAGRSSDQLLDLGNYANRFGLDNLGLKITYGDTPVSNEEAKKKSKFQQFLDKYGKKAEYSFNNRQSNLAPMYNLMKASEPLASQYRPSINLKYAETPMLDPLPIVQELYNQRRLATQNINTNSPTGQAFVSNIDSQTQKKTIDVLNDIQQKNAQIAAQNEAGRVNAYNQEQQLNIAANQQYMQAMQQAQAQKDEMMGSALGDLDRMRNSKIKSMNDFNSLAAMTPGMMKTNNPLDLLSGRQGFDMDKDYMKLYYAIAQAKTPEEAEALRKAYENKKKQAAEKVVAQAGGSINSFFKKKYT
jgi:hypothetical protein